MNTIARQVSSRLSSSTGMSESSNIHPAHRPALVSTVSSSSSISNASNSSRFSKISQTFSTWSRESKNNLKTFAVGTPWITGVPSAETYQTREQAVQGSERRRKSSSYFPALGGSC